MRKILSFLTAILFAGSMMAETYTVDFENEAASYTDWTITQMTTRQTNSNVTAHGGDYFGTTGGKATASMVTASAIANPSSITFYVSKASTNTTASSWLVKVSEDGEEWTTVGDAQSASSGITRGTWYEVTRDLSSYSNVYVGVFYEGTTAVRCIDDLTLVTQDGEIASTGKTFYLALSADWAGWPAKYSMYYFKSDNSASGFSAFMTAVPDTTNIYTGTIPDGYDKMIFVRHDGEASEPNWENKWSQTVDLNVPTNDDNLFTVVSGGTGSECNGTWSVYGEEPAPYVPTLENGFYLIGKINGVAGWEAAGLAADRKFEGNPENNAEFMVNVTLAEGDELKVVNVLNDAITAWFPAEGGNYVVDANHAGEKTIYFRPDNQGGEDWFGACIYIAPNAEPQPAAAVVLPATLDVTNVSFRSEGMPDFVIEEGQDYAGTYFDMGAHDSSNDTLLYAEWNVTIEPIKYNIAVDVYNENSWRVQLYLLSQAGDTLKSLRYKGSSEQKGQFAIGSLDLSDLEAGDYKVIARAATAWSKMKLKDVIFTADYQGVNVDLPGTLLPAYAELSAGASIANNAIAFAPSTANNEYALWNVSFAEAGNYNVTIDMTASNGHTYGVALLNGETEVGAVAEAQSWDTGVKELGAIEVPAAGSYVVKLTNATQWSEAVLNSITFAAPQPQGCDWDNIDFIGDGSPEQTFGNQFKICKAGDQPGVVNIQKPGFAAESGIYVTFPSAAFGEISLAEGQYVIDGAGMVLYCSAFTALETEVTVVCEGNDIVFTVYNAKGGTPEPAANYYVIGSMTGWEVSEDYILTPNNEAEGQEFMGEFTFAANDAFKVVKNNKEVWYPDGVGNDFVISETGDYTVYFRPNGDGGEDWHYGYIYAAKKEATAISNTAADAEAVKVLNNGMLLIRKGDKTYNIMGQAVK